MAKTKKLGKKQIAVIEELVSGELDEHEALKKHGVSASAFGKWLSDGVFVEELGRRMNWLRQRCDLMVARRKSIAAARLAELTTCENPETARKACLDIIQFNPAGDFGSEQCDAKCSDEDTGYDGLSAETAGKLLAVLAEDGVS